MWLQEGRKKHGIKFFYGWMDQLTWNSGRFEQRRNAHTPLLIYSTKQGHELLRNKHVLPNLAKKKWSGILPINHKFSVEKCMG
jgi:hypothetical protein